jgi:hypothetical protein
MAFDFSLRAARELLTTGTRAMSTVLNTCGSASRQAFGLHVTYDFMCQRCRNKNRKVCSRLRCKRDLEGVANFGNGFRVFDDRANGCVHLLKYVWVCVDANPLKTCYSQCRPSVL